MAGAVAVQAESHLFEQKVHTSLQNLRLRDWADDADDVLSVFEFLCSARGDGLLRLEDDRCVALRERHISKHAVVLRYVMVLACGHNGKVDEALAAADDLLDDIAESDSVSEFDRNSAWALWSSRVPAAKKPPRRRAGSVDAGWGLALALYLGYVRPEQLNTIMAALTDDTQSVVASTVAMAIPLLGLEMPAEHSPQRYLDEEMLRPVARFIADLAKKSATESVS